MPREAFDLAVRNACMSADKVSMAMRDAVPAQRTEQIIRRALDALIANGIIMLNDQETWPDWYIPDPPYKFPKLGDDT
jgi:glycerol dehydrogenase-like iron-containing ADH family enzyme